MIPLKDFKKISEDKKTVTMKHMKNGHELTLMVSKLTPIEKEALKRLEMHKGEKESLADGGKVKRKMYASPDEPVSADDDAPEVEAPSAEAPAIVPRETSQVQSAGVPAYGVAGKQQSNPAAVGPLEQEAQGYEQKAVADSGIATQNAKDKVAQDAQLQQRMLDIQQNAKEIQGHTNDFAQYAKQNPIRANAYQEDMSTPKKVTNAVGMLLAGFGGAGKPAMDFLNKQIDRNVAAQQQNFTNQGTVWHAYESLYHDKNIATNMAKATGAEMLANQISQTADRYGTQQAQAAKNIALGQLGAKHAEEIGLAATRLDGLRKGQLPLNPGPAGVEAQKAQQQSGPPQALQQNPSVSPTVGPSDNEGPQPLISKLISYATDKGQAEPEPQVQTTKNGANGNHIYQLLEPDAQDTLDSLRFNPRAKGDIKDIEDKYNQVNQAQKVLNGPNNDGKGGIHELMNDMYKNVGGTDKGSASNIGAYGTHMRRTLEEDVPNVPYVGPALSAASKFIPPDDAYKQFKTSAVQMETDLGTALKGLILPSDLHKMVEANLPAFGDNKADVARKEKAIINEVLKALPTQKTNTWGLTKLGK